MRHLLFGTICNPSKYLLYYNADTKFFFRFRTENERKRKKTAGSRQYFAQKVWRCWFVLLHLQPLRMRKTFSATDWRCCWCVTGSAQKIGGFAGAQQAQRKRLRVLLARNGFSANDWRFCGRATASAQMIEGFANAQRLQRKRLKVLRASNSFSANYWGFCGRAKALSKNENRFCGRATETFQNSKN